MICRAISRRCTDSHHCEGLEDEATQRQKQADAGDGSKHRGRETGGKHDHVGEGRKIHHLMRIHENYAKLSVTWTRSACAVSSSMSWFLEPAASLIRDSCSHWWVYILCWLSTCNIDRVWTTLLPTPSPLTFPLLLSPLHTHLARFLSVSLPLPLAPWSDDSALFAKARGCRVTGTQWANSSLGSTSGLKLSPVYWKAGLVEL